MANPTGHERTFACQIYKYTPVYVTVIRPVLDSGLCSNALGFASANANAAFALVFDCHVMDAFALAYDSSAFAIALAFD